MKHIPGTAAFALSLALVGLLGCGGGDTATSATNHPPAFSTTAPTTATVGTQYSYTPAATDPDGDRVAISIVSGSNPLGSTFSAGTYTWTPAANQGNTVCSLRIQASDGKGGTVDQTWTVTPAAAPQPTGTFQTSGAVVTAAGENATFNLTFAAPVQAQAVQPAGKTTLTQVASSASLGQAQGLLTFAPGQVSIGGIVMGGTFDPSTGALVLVGGGYEFNGTAVFQNGQLSQINGTFKTLSTGLTGPTSTLNPATPDPAVGTFTATGSLAQGRSAHSATLLTNGKVLMVGGEGKVSGNFTRLTSAELYDSVTGTFSATGSLNYATEEHTATLLSDGTVLIIGGRDSNNTATDRVERYNPATGQFTLQNSLNHVRLMVHTATLLPNGKVLVVGGASVAGGTIDTSVAIAELYEPDATNGPNPARKGKSTDTGSLNVARSEHTAMLHPTNNNYVLILGGLVGGEGGDSATTEESYNITSGLFEIIQPTPTVKRGASACVYLGGLRWLNAGGYNFDTKGVLATAEIVDGNANGGQGAIIATGSMPVPLFLSESVRLLDGRVLLTGGISDITTFAGVNVGLVFNPAANSGVGAFTATTNTLSSPRYRHTATLLPNGTVLVAGGQPTDGDGAEWLATANLYH